ncbi:MAG TPA: triple tyrosine motif-containing protein, partial [Acidobacteriaceae bacterium]
LAQRFAVRRRTPLLALLAALALTACSLAQTAAPPKPSSQLNEEGGMPVLQNYTAKDIGGGGQMWSILQDRRGLMYFGSGGVILQYDGVTWRTIFIPTGVVRSLALDDSGRIWLGGAANFGYLAPDAAGTLHFVSILDKAPAERGNFTSVWQTLVTPQGIFFRSYERLFRWDGEHMHVWPAAPKSRFEALSAVRGHIYTSQGGIGLEEIVGDDLRPVPGGDGYANSAKLFLYPYDAAHLIASARDQLLTLYDGQKVTPFPTQADDYLRKHRVYTSIVLPDGSLCVTTLDGGAVILGHDGKLRQILDPGAGLQSGNVLSAYTDREGALWLGLANGISRVEVNSPISLFSRTDTIDVAHFNGSVYVTSGGGSAPVQRLVSDPLTGRPSTVVLRGPSQAFSLTIFKDPAGKTPDQLLVATNDGVMRAEGDNLSFAMPAVHGPTEQTYDVYQSKKTPSRVFLGHANGVSSMRWDGKTWIDEGRLPNSVYSATNMVEDAQGILWVSGGDGGVLRVTVADTGAKDSKAEVISQNDGLPPGGYDVEFVAGSIYATGNRARHIFRWDEASHKFVVDDRFLLPTDAPDSTSSLLPGPDGKVWALNASSSDRRFGLFSRQPDGTWRADEDSYRKLNRFSVFNLHSESDGSIWVTGDQLIRFAPRTAQAAPQPVPVLVRQVNAGKQVVFGGMSVPGAPELRLPPGTDALRFQFAAISYDNPTETDYQYLLEGADRDWSAWGKQKEANYSGLGPGSYQFHVRARTDDGRIGDEGLFAFTIAPRWYRSTLAYVVYGLLLLLLAFVAWRLISRHEREKGRRKTEALEAQARALEATVNERTEEIRTQAAEITAQKDSIELLSEIGKEITASLDLNTILFKLYERVNQIVDASIFGVGLYRPEKHLIEYSLAIENGKRYAPYTRSTDDKNQFAVWCIDHRQPILLN